MSINMNVLDSFFVALGFQVDTDGIEKFQHRTEELKAAALRLGAIAAGAAVGIGLMVEKVAESMGEIQHFAELNKLSAREVAAFNRVGEDNLITNEAMESSLQSLNVKTGEAAAGVGRGAMIFKKFGLSAKDAHGNVKSFNQILGDVSAKMQKASRQTNLAMAARLGLDPKMVPLLEKGKEYLDKLTGEAAAAIPFTDEDYERALKVDILFTKAKRTVGLFASQIAVSLMPVVQKALEKFIAWYTAMRSDTASNFNRTLRALAFTVETLWAWFSRLVDVLTGAGKWLSKFAVAGWAAKAAVAALIAYQVGSWARGAAQALGLLVKALWAMAGASDALNATLLGGSLLIIALLVDDIWNWYEGNESVIGQLFTKYPQALSIVRDALILLTALWLRMKWAAITSMLETMEILVLYAAEWIGSFWAMAVAAWAAAAPVLAVVAPILLVLAALYLLYRNWTDIYNYFAGTWELLGEKVDEYVKKVEGAWQKVKGFFGFGDSPGASVIQQGAAGGGSASGTALGAPSRLMGMPSHSSASNSTVHNTITGTTVNVYSPDADKAGQSVKEALQPAHTRTSIRNAQSGVLL